MGLSPMDEARAFASANLKQLAAEVLAWQHGKLIADGGLLNTLAAMCEKGGFDRDQHQQAERLVVIASLEQSAAA